MNMNKNMNMMLLLACSFLALSVLPSHAAIFQYTEGHGHFGLGYDEMPDDPRDRANGTNLFDPLNADGGLFPHVAAADATSNLWAFAPGPYGPDQVDHIVPFSTFQPRPDSPELDAALGNSGGDFMWILPESQTVAAAQNAPWTGPEVEEEAYEFFDDINGADGNVNWSLENVVGPGEVALWVSDTFGGVGDVWMGSADGFNNDTIVLSEGALHQFMGFTLPGYYEVTFNWEVSIGGEWVDESATFTFDVIPEPSAGGLLLGASALFLMLTRKRRA